MSGCSDEDLVAAYREGLTLEEVGERFGISWRTVHRRIRKAAPWVMRSPGNPPPKEPNERDLRIIENRRAGMKLREIAALEGITHQRVFNILKRWKYQDS